MKWQSVGWFALGKYGWGHLKQSQVTEKRCSYWCAAVLERAFSTIYHQENVELDRIREVHTLPIPFQNVLQMLFPLPGTLLPMSSPLSLDGSVKLSVPRFEDAFPAKTFLVPQEWVLPLPNQTWVCSPIHSKAGCWNKIVVKWSAALLQVLRASLWLSW